MKKISSIVALLLIILTGAIVSGCGPDYSSLSLSLRNAEQIELSITDEAVDYYIVINNYFDMNAKFNFAFEKNIAQIVDNSVEDKGNGVFKFQISPITYGSTTLTITLKGLKKELIVPVVVRKALNSMTANTNVFVKKGSTLQLSSSMFTFDPQETTEKGLTFALADNEDYANNDVQFNTSTNILSVGADCALNSINIIATSTYDTNIQETLSIKVVQDIDISSLLLQIASQNAENPLEFGTYSPLNTTDEIELTISEPAEYQKQIKVDYALFNSGYSVDVYATSGLTLGNDNIHYISLIQNSSFVLSAIETGEGYITLRAYSRELPENYTEVKIKVNVMCKPNAITANGQTELGLVELYTNAKEVKEYKFGISPAKANKDAYSYTLSYFSGLTSQSIEGATPVANINDYTKYLDIKYGGAVLASKDLDSLNSSLTLKVKENLSDDEYNEIKDKYFALKVDCVDDKNGVLCSFVMYIKVYKGTTEFTISDEYANGTIYLALDNTLQTQEAYEFYGLKCSEGATPGKLTISSNSSSMNICSIAQITPTATTLRITPIHVGEQSFVITTANNYSVVLKVVVFRALSSPDELIMQIADFSNDKISSFYPKETTRSLEQVELKGRGATVDIISKTLTNFSDYSEISYSYILKFENNEYFTVSGNKTIEANKLTSDKQILSVNIVYNTVEKNQNNYYSFVLTENSVTKSIEFTCVNYIKELSLYASHDSNGENLSKTPQIYNKGDLSYKNQELATVYLYMTLAQSENEVYKNLTIDNFAFRSGAEFDKTAQGSYYKIGEIGYFYPNEEYFAGYEGDPQKPYIGYFTYDYNLLGRYSELSIILSITDKSTKNNFSSNVNLSIEKYVDVESIWLSSPETTIYLDNTKSNNSKTIIVQVMPAEAMCKDLAVLIESNATDCLDVKTTGNVITFKYKNAGQGDILIFPISKMKTNSYKDSLGNYYYHLKLRFRCADGLSEQSALKISNLADVRNIQPDLHYFVDGIINCQGEAVDIPALNNGSLRGTFEAEYTESGAVNPNFALDQQIGGIVNFVVKNNGTNNLGLIRQIGANAKIYNLSISGLFDSTISLNANTNIGLLCGHNLGTIKNVNVSLYSKNDVVIECATGTQVNIGLVAGLNDKTKNSLNQDITGQILVDSNSKDYTLMANNENASLLTINLDTAGKSVTSYFGGVVGYNMGTISQTFDNGDQFITVGLYGVTSNIYAKTNATYMASVAGLSTGVITGLKATGEIWGFVDSSVVYSKYVAGLVGWLKDGAEISNSTSRVFVRGKNIVAGFVAGVDNVANVTLANNKVQAVDDGSRTGINASIIIAYEETSSMWAVSYNNQITSGVMAETYFDRDLPTDLVAYLNSHDDLTSDENDPYIPKAEVDINYYFGELIQIKNEKLVNIDTKNLYRRGEEDKLINENFINFIILSAYKKAKQSANQSLISNKIDTLSLLKFVNIIEVNDAGEIVSKVKDINIEVLTPLTGQVELYGKTINLKDIGQLSLKITSALNYKKFANVGVYITTYYESVRVYADKDKSMVLDPITLVNNQTTIAYLDAYSNLYNYNNTPVELDSNQEVVFDYALTTNVAMDVKLQGQTVFLSKVGDSVTNFTSYITFTSKFNFGDKDYYKYLNKTVTLSSGEVYAFVLDSDYAKLSAQPEEIEKHTVEVKGTFGIEDIRLNKSYVTAQPSDNIEFELSYITYNPDDKIEVNLKVYDSVKNDNYRLFTLIDNKFLNEAGKLLFTLNSKNVTSVDGREHIKYTFKMPVDTDFDQDVYDYLKNRQIELIFSSKNASSQNAKLTINYEAETISSILVNNYSKELNSDIIEVNDGIYTIYQSNMLYAGQQASTGEMNVLNAYIYTSQSEFDYVEASIDYAVEGAFIGYIEYTAVGSQVIGKLSNNSVYTSITSGSVLKIFKKDIKRDANSNTLIVGLAYNFPKTIADNTIVPITLKAYKDGEVVYTQTTSLVTKLPNQVDFEIDGKKPVLETEDYKVYNVARGMSYLLNTTLVGYGQDEAMFESTNPGIASISKQGNDFYLKISDVSIPYGKDADGNDMPYFEITIRAYGKKVEQGREVSSAVKTTKLRVFEFIVDENDLFGDNQISLRMLEEVDIKDIISSKIKFEYSKSVASALSTFTDSYKENAQFIFVDENGDEHILTEGFVKELEGVYSIKCYKDAKNNNKLKFMFKPMQIGEPNNYKFKVRHIISYKNGVPVATEITNDIIDLSAEQEFDVYTHIASTGDNPIPVFNADDLYNKIIDGEYYRLVNDITIPASEFKMITAHPKMFDGNGYKITIGSGVINSDLSESSNFALFESVDEDAVFKNITITIAGNLNITLDSTNASGANVAMLVAENNGIITNCAVKSASLVSLNIIGTVEVMERSNFAGLVANNLGYITNSQVECNLSASGASLGGVVADNSGHISSTYIKNSRIYNTTSTTNENIVTGGFVCKNSGQITSSFVEGISNSARIYSDYPNGDYSLTSKIIYTATKVAGFVFENSGTITDCYSNIPIVSSNESSGFVASFIDGTIERAFSLCKLKQQDTLNYGFVAEVGDDVEFIDCFFIIQNGIINYNTSTTNYNLENGEYTSVIKGVTPLTIEQFDVTKEENQENFKSFITNSQKNHGVWFFAYDENIEKQIFSINTYSCAVEGFEDSTGKSLEFNARRLQLVSPNMIAYSKYDFVLPEGSSLASGEYSYTLSSGVESVGSMLNPIIITSATEFEQYLMYPKLGYEYYRLARDLDYETDEIYSSKLYNKKFLGYLEGNGFSISNYSVNAIVSNLSGGLFAEVGSSLTLTSCIKNVSFAPAYINLPNCVYVGALAGSVSNANILNVEVTGDDVLVLGNNIVGGVFGRTYGETNISLISSNVSAKSSYYNSVAIKNSSDVSALISEISFVETGINKSKTSYAGALIGYVGGFADVSMISVGANSKVMAMTAGLMFGGVGALAKVSDFNLTLNSFNNQIVAYAFGGLVAGEVLGEVSNFKITSDIVNKNLFNCYPTTPIAVGGVAGYANNATIKDMSESKYTLICAKVVGVDNLGFLNPHNPYIVKYVGGVVGYGKKITVNNINAKLGIMGGSCVGGVAGYLDSNSSTVIDSNITNVSINLFSQKTFTNQNGDNETDKFYISYNSSAVSESDNYSFDEHQHFGLIYGFGISGDGYSASQLKDLQSSNDNTVTIDGTITIRYCAYGIDESLVENFAVITFNSKGAKQVGGSIDYIVFDFTENKNVFSN